MLILLRVFTKYERHLYKTPQNLLKIEKINFKVFNKFY